MRSLRVALISGPQYERIHGLISSFTRETGVDVEVAFEGDHGALNRRLANELPDGVSYDLISTHSKFAPSQSEFLRPLDEWLEDPAAFRPRVLKLCRYRGKLYSVPRNVDVRVLWVHADLLLGCPAPETWEELLECAGHARRRDVAGYAFPGRGGLFSSLLELTVAAGGELFSPDDEPRFQSREVRQALEWLVTAHRVRCLTPRELPGWTHAEVSEHFRRRRIAMIGDWPGNYPQLARSSAYAGVTVHRYPRGSVRRSAYGGVHSYAIPRDARDAERGFQLLRYLTSRPAAERDAEAGLFPARRDVRPEPRDDLDRRRLQLIEETVAEDLTVFPSLKCYPAIESVAEAELIAALVGKVSPGEVLRRLQMVVANLIEPEMLGRAQQSEPTRTAKPAP